jgi:hypothetical protein
MKWPTQFSRQKRDRSVRGEAINLEAYKKLFFNLVRYGISERIVNSENVPDRPGQKVACLIVKGFPVENGTAVLLGRPKANCGCGSNNTEIGQQRHQRAPSIV